MSYLSRILVISMDTPIDPLVIDVKSADGHVMVTTPDGNRWWLLSPRDEGRIAEYFLSFGGPNGQIMPTLEGFQRLHRENGPPIELADGRKFHYEMPPSWVEWATLRLSLGVDGRSD